MDVHDGRLGIRLERPPILSQIWIAAQYAHHVSGFCWATNYRGPGGWWPGDQGMHPGDPQGKKVSSLPATVLLNATWKASWPEDPGI